MFRMNPFTRITAAIGALLSSFPGGLFGATSTGPRLNRGRRPEKAGHTGRLLWNSDKLGPAYRLHDAQGRTLYVPLKSVPFDKRIPRRARKSGAVVAEVRARA